MGVNKESAIKELKEIVRKKGMLNVLVNDVTEIALKNGVDVDILNEEFGYMINGKPCASTYCKYCGSKLTESEVSND